MKIGEGIHFIPMFSGRESDETEDRHAYASSAHLKFVAINDVTDWPLQRPQT